MNGGLPGSLRRWQTVFVRRRNERAHRWPSRELQCRCEFKVCNGALEIRENGGVGNAQSDIAYAPTIGFHWANRVAGLLALRSDGIFSFLKQNGSRAVVDCDVPYATAANKLRREGGVDTSWWWSGQGGQPGLAVGRQ